MNNIQYKSYQYITLKGVFPYAYGRSPSKVLLSRACYLLTGRRPNQTSIQQRSTKWVARNQNLIHKAYKENTTHSLIIKLPFQNISLEEAIQEEYFIIKKSLNHSGPEIIIRDYNVKYINYNCIRPELLRELLLTTTVGATKQILDFLGLGYSNIIGFQCALIIGLVKGLAKSVSDRIIYNKEVTLPKMQLKCLIDMLAEITTFLCTNISEQPLNPAYKSAIKGCFKYSYKHLFQRILILITSTELIFEICKSSFKGFLRAYFFSILGQFIGPMIGSIIGAIIVNLLIDQCTLSPKYHH